MIKRQLKNILLTLVISTFALTACGGNNAEPTPTMNPILIQTQAVETFSAVLTQTALAAPSDTPVPTLTPAPTFPPLATNTIGVPLGTLPTTAGGNTSCYGLTFVSDVTVPDNTQMAPGQAFTKTWKVKNSGTCAWDAGFKFASTGGWTLATKPITELYASLDLIPLTAEQQQRVEEVAAAVYRPCCNNPTLFPDCNHGMAMLGLLELMASQGASTDQMFEAAKYINAFWFPQQNLETALYLKANQNVNFEDANARLVTGAEFSSGSGFASTHQQLQTSGLLPQAPQQGGSCVN